MRRQVVELLASALCAAIGGTFMSGAMHTSPGDGALAGLGALLVYRGIRG